MKPYYVTLNNSDEAKQISFALLEQQLAVCTNWFSITCAYRWEGEISLEPEVVLVIKTKSELRYQIEQIIQQHVSYINFIAEISPSYVNPGFLAWPNKEVKIQPIHPLTTGCDSTS
ncbi:MAG TPA: divalent-cation tolerance protein CutA [Coleofasciculaceae cyanobacterium]